MKAVELFDQADLRLPIARPHGDFATFLAGIYRKFLGHVVNVKARDALFRHVHQNEPVSGRKVCCCT